MFDYLLNLFNVLAIKRADILRVDRSRTTRGRPRLRLEDNVQKYLAGDNERVIRNVKMSDGSSLHGGPVTDTKE